MLLMIIAVGGGTVLVTLIGIGVLYLCVRPRQRPESAASKLARRAKRIHTTAPQLAAMESQFRQTGSRRPPSPPRPATNDADLPVLDSLATFVDQHGALLAALFRLALEVSDDGRNPDPLPFAAAFTALARYLLANGRPAVCHRDLACFRSWL